VTSRPSSTPIELSPPVVDVSDLQVTFAGPDRRAIPVVNGVSFSVHRGKVLGIVGESGSGKTMTSLSLLGLVPRPGRVTATKLVVDGIDTLRLDDRSWARVRGKNVSMVFQDALSGLNPVRTIGSTLIEVIRRHQDSNGQEARNLAIDALQDVGIAEADARLGFYPHQLSGGLRQRVMIAMALVNRPALVVADEPTTALDATIQAQLLDLLTDLVSDAALILVTHDLGVVAAICDEVAVMYAGRFVEVGSVGVVLLKPRHPYTIGLLKAVPRFEKNRGLLIPVRGTPPQPGALPQGCAFAPRCDSAIDRCLTESPPSVVIDDHTVACWNPITS